MVQALQGRPCEPRGARQAARRYYERKRAIVPDHWLAATRAWRKANPERWQAVALAASRRRYARMYRDGATDVTADALAALLDATSA